LKSTGSELREIAYGLFLHALGQCGVEQAFTRKVKRVSGEHSESLWRLGDDVIDLDGIRRIRIVAVGKAASTMLHSLLPFFDGLTDCELSGVLITSHRPSNLPRGFQFFAGGHPTPNQASIDGAKAALDLVRSLRRGAITNEDSLCLFLVSGGASAMMELPTDSTISLEDTVGFHRELVHSGGSIAEINCVRKHFSAIKGGRLAMEAEGLSSYSILVSDVPSGRLDALGSGPTLPDTSTVEECREVLARYGLLKRFPASVRQFFASEELRETPKPAQLSARVLTLLSADDTAVIAKQRAEQLGFYAVIDNTCDDWDYDAAAEYLLNRLHELRREHSHVCLVSSGEVTVELPGSELDNAIEVERRVGGRNQHFALHAATLLKPSDASMAILSAGTDGIDGNSSAAGAIVDEKSLYGDEQRLIRAREALRHFDSGTFLQEEGLSIVTGPTGNNLRDLRILLARKPQ
jgi:hydroxypyruvate reductase